MTLWEFLLTSEMAPFSAGFSLILLFLLLELLSLLLGGSLFGLDGGTDIDGPDIDLPEIDAPDLDLPDFDAPDLDAPGVDGAAADATGAASGVLSLVGLGDAPFMVWLIAALTGFSVSGYAAQLALRELTGTMLSPWLVGVGAVFVGLFVAKRLSRKLANLLPQVQTEAVSETRLGGRTGVITVGTARVGKPAEAKVTDRFGNAHYIRVEPFRPDQELSAGTEIAVMRRHGRIYRAVRLED